MRDTSWFFFSMTVTPTLPQNTSVLSAWKLSEVKGPNELILSLWPCFPPQGASAHGPDHPLHRYPTSPRRRRAAGGNGASHQFLTWLVFIRSRYGQSLTCVCECVCVCDWNVWMRSRYLHLRTEKEPMKHSGRILWDYNKQEQETYTNAVIHAVNVKTRQSTSSADNKRREDIPAALMKTWLRWYFPPQGRRGTMQVKPRECEEETHWKS